MLRRQAYKFRLRARPAQEALFRRFAGCRRFVWNKALAEQQARRERGEKYAGYVDMAKWLTAWRADPATAFLSEAPVHALQEALKSLDEAFKHFFKKAGGYPRFKRRGLDGFRETDKACFALDQVNARIKLPKIGWVRYRASQSVPGELRSVILSRGAQGWHVAIQTEIDAPALSGGTGAVGVDRGITNFIATSDGERVAPLNAHRTALHRLRKYQRTYSRRMEAAKVAAGISKGKPFPKGFRLVKSNRLRRAESAVQRQHAKVARVRQDWLHKQSLALANDNALIVIEDLNIRNMSASAAGDEEALGKHVRQKAGLNRSILDQGWSEFARQLKYKLDWRGGQLLKVPAAYTSQRCSCCGFTDAGNRHKERFTCLSCGYSAHADAQAAINILAAGHAVLAGISDASHADVEDAAPSGRPIRAEKPARAKRQSTRAEALCVPLI